MPIGVVKFFNEAGGVGYITQDGTYVDHYVHVSALVTAVREGDKVVFDLHENVDGTKAVNVKTA